MLQKIEVSLRQLAAQPSVSAERLAWATSQVNLFFGSFRKADADDPETFTAGCLRLFTAYPQAAVQYVVDPLTGLPGKSEWLPTLRAVKEALDAWEGEQKRICEAEQRHIDAERQIAERRIWQEAQKTKPTLDEMKAKYGPNWGLKAEAENAEAKARRKTEMDRVNQRAFEMECEAAGFPSDSPISPSLAAVMKSKSAAA